MKKLWLFCFMVMVLAHPVAAADAAFRPEFASPGVARQALLGRVLGRDFLQGVGAFPPGLLVSEVDLNGDRVPDIVAVQKGFCSNHACTFHFLLHESTGVWEEAAAVESWAIPYILPAPAGTLCGLVIFDHVTDDCLSCSEPQPVRMEWKQGRSGMAGSYVVTGPVPEDRAAAFKPGWSWRNEW